MKQKKYSLYFILGLLIVLIATFSITLISTYQYIKTKNDLKENIKTRSSDSLEKLQQLLVPYLESYSVSEYENILTNEMRNKHILAIVVKDYNMGKVLGKEYLETGKTRDTNWNAIKYDSFNKSIKAKLLNSYLVQSDFIYNKNGIKIGEIFIYNTDRFMQSELKEIIKQSIYFIVFISVILIILSYFLIHRVIIKPLEKINESIKQNSIEGVLLKPIPQGGFQEIDAVSDTINKMIFSIKESQEKLTYLNENLNNRVIEKTKELQELNLSLEKRIQEELEKSQKKDLLLHNQSRFASMGEMIGNIAHQWRQPLNALSITIQKIQRYYELGKLDEESLDRSIEKSMNLIQKMSSTIDDFMGFFREDKVKLPFDVNEAIDETLTLLEASIKNNFINLQFQHTQEPIIVEGYKGEFTQVILNIISNAKDAIKENSISAPKIDVRLTKDETYIIIEICDNAGGIDEKIIDNIFDPYFTTKEESQGTGIGLYMSKIIIEQNMNGYLEVRNEKEGACFTIKLEHTS